MRETMEVKEEIIPNTQHTFFNQTEPLPYSTEDYTYIRNLGLTFSFFALIPGLIGLAIGIYGAFLPIAMGLITIAIVLTTIIGLLNIGIGLPLIASGSECRGSHGSIQSL
jgi:hypothetical protein